MKSKKLQVFISSTFKDMKKERQAAVEAVLTAGHIPAGMELFTAGDENQMKVIKRWIEESDVYMLILGGRYGEIEPKSKKSYTHLEYEYALKVKKPYFTVVINKKSLDEKIKNHGNEMKEEKNLDKLQSFRKFVTSDVMVKFFDDEKDIQLAIHQTLYEFESRKEIVGWVKNENQININQLTNEVTRLSEENSVLRKQITKQAAYDNRLDFDQIYKLLENDRLNSNVYEFKEHQEKIQEILLDYKLDEFNSLAYFILFADGFHNGYWHNNIFKYTQMLIKIGLVKGKMNSDHYMLEDGRRFHLQLLAKRISSE